MCGRQCAQQGCGAIADALQQLGILGDGGKDIRDVCEFECVAFVDGVDEVTHLLLDAFTIVAASLGELAAFVEGEGYG